MSTFDSINPYTLEVNGTFTRHTNEELDAIIQTAHEAFLDWKDTSFDHRKALFLKMADNIEKNIVELSRLETIEMGMLNTTSQAILKSTASMIRWYVDNLEKYLGDEPITEKGIDGKYVYDPLGVIYGIAPWNFPYKQVLRAAVANILAGNTTVYKHSSDCPLCGQAIEDLFTEAGFPAGIYTNIYSSGSQSEHILANPLIAGTNLTGGEGAGSAVGSLAGKYLKPSVLELGGNDAFVLADHEDTKKMAHDAVACRISMGGQRCNGSKRFIILEKHYDDFVQAMKEHMEGQVRGDPFDTNTTIPPLANSKMVNEVAGQVEKTVAEGARLMIGGKIAGEDKQFYEPTVLADVTPDMTSFREEIFGPVASIIKSKSIEESIELANNSEFGLSATVRGDDIDQLKEIADQLDGGMIFINSPANAMAKLPFGGVRKSGYGKENGPEGLRAFTNKKAVVYNVT